MSSLETTELKLRTTPTGGVSGEHSPYYRRLLSAGYKGYLQGTLGGAGYYGLLGLAVGTVVGLAAAPFTAGASLWLIPAVGGLGVLKGADTFGSIGSVAAINAESADLAEQRRYLLDRYYDLPEGPEGDKQAEIIKDELQTQVRTREPHQLFHWKTVAICAVVGAALAFTFLSPMGLGLLSGGPLFHLLTGAHLVAEGTTLTATAVAANAGVTTGILMALGTAVGALAGATIGIDRHYVRAWFDGTEKILHDESHSQQAILARAQQVDRIKAAAAVDEQTRLIIERGGNLHLNESELKSPAQSTTLAAAAATIPLQHKPAALAETPDTTVHSAITEQRIKDVQKMMDII